MRNDKTPLLMERQVYIIERQQMVDLSRALKQYTIPLPIPNKFRVVHNFKNGDNTLTIHQNIKNEIKVVISRKKTGKYVPWTNDTMFDMFFAIKDNKLINPLSTIGSDEVGKSDYLGPIIVAGTAWKNQESIFDTGDSDSKKISFYEAAKLEDKIKNNCVCSFSLIKPIKMAHFYQNSSKKLNLNHLLLYYHIVTNMKIFKKIEGKRKEEMFFAIDDFLNNNPNLEAKYFDDMCTVPEIKEFKATKVSLKWIIKGDETNDLIKLASIYAKYIFQLEMKKIFSEISKYMDVGNSFKIILGNSNELKRIIEELVKIMPIEKSREIIKPLYWAKFNIQ